MNKEIVKNEHHIKAFDRVVEYIEQHINENISLETLADIANSSKYHFHRLFKEYFRESISDYIKKRRLTYAAYQLVDTKKKITDIALEMNYSTLGSFTRAFTKKFKITPAEYRKKNLLYPYQVTPKLSLERLIHKPPKLVKTVFPETKLIGFKQKGIVTDKDLKVDRDFVELFWEFMNTLWKHNYPVKDAKLFHVNKTIDFRFEPNGGFYKEYEEFHGVLYNGCQELSHLTQYTIPQKECVNFCLQGPYSEYDKVLWLLYENYFPTLPYQIDMSYIIGEGTLGLNGDFLNSSGNLDYEKMSTYYRTVKYEEMFNNSPENQHNFFLPYFTE